MTDLAAALDHLPERRGTAPWPDHEYVKGWGVMGLPLDSGHYLALRVFPENDFAPYKTLWHRDSEGRWSTTSTDPASTPPAPATTGWPARTSAMPAST